MIRFFLILTMTFFILPRNVIEAGNREDSAVKIKVLSGEKDIYHPGDTVELMIMIKLPLEICSDGLKFAKVFGKGMDIIEQKDWVAVKPGFWKKKMILVLNANNDNFGQLTIIRKADKGSIFHKKQFHYR